MYLVDDLTFSISLTQKRYIHFALVLGIANRQISVILTAVIIWCNSTKGAVCFLYLYYDNHNNVKNSIP